MNHACVVPTHNTPLFDSAAQMDVPRCARHTSFRVARDQQTVDKESAAKEASLGDRSSFAA